jgi:hypothetical protein
MACVGESWRDRDGRRFLMTMWHRQTVPLVGWALFAPLLCLAPIAQAVDIPVTPKKLIVVDKLTAASKAKVVYVSKDQAAGITKGTGTDPAQISVQFDMLYGNEAAAGSFTLPAGASDGTAGWVVNKSTVAKYVNKNAPGGPTEAKVGVVKPGKLLKLVGKGLGDTPLDVFGAGDPVGSVFTAYCVDNAGDEFCHCSEFTGCTYKLIAGDTGAKLVCKRGEGDPGCNAVVPPTTTSTSLLPCGVIANTCFGTCPSGQTCLATSSYCLGGLTPGAPCNPAAPVCPSGLCVPSACACGVTTTTTSTSSTTSTTLALTCGDLTYPECNGPCPPGMYCTTLLPGAGAPCGCASSSECTGNLCYGGFCSPGCPPGYVCVSPGIGLPSLGQGPACGSDCGCPPTGLPNDPGICLIL